MNVHLSAVAIIATFLLSGCSTKQPLLSPMTPVKIESSSVNKMKKEEVQSIVSKMMNETVKKLNGAQYLTDPKHLAISTKRDWQTKGDGQYVVWEKKSYSYAYGYYYDDEKKEIIEVPSQTCLSSYLSGSTKKINITEWDCNEFKIYDPGDDFKNTILAFRSYLSSTFPTHLAEYNSKITK